MRPTAPQVVVAAGLLALVGGLTWALLVPPATTGTPATQPYRIEPDLAMTNYRVTANASLRCRNASRSVTVIGNQTAHVDRSAGVRRSERTVRTANETFAYSVYRTGRTRYRRSQVGTDPPEFERDRTVAPVSPELVHYQPVFPRLLRFEWAVVDEGANRTRFRPKSGYWVGPATAYGIRHRLFVASASGHLVTAADGTLVDLALTAATVRASNRLERFVGPRERCSTHLAYQLHDATDPVATPAWVATARNATAGWRNVQPAFDPSRALPPGRAGEPIRWQRRSGRGCVDTLSRRSSCWRSRGAGATTPSST